MSCLWEISKLSRWSTKYLHVSMGVQMNRTEQKQIRKINFIIRFINKVYNHLCHTCSFLISFCNRHHALKYNKYFAEDVNIGTIPLFLNRQKLLQQSVQKNNTVCYQQTEDNVQFGFFKYSKARTASASIHMAKWLWLKGVYTEHLLLTFWESLLWKSKSLPCLHNVVQLHPAIEGDKIPAVEIWECFCVTDTRHFQQQLTYLPLGLRVLLSPQLPSLHVAD